MTSDQAKDIARQIVRESTDDVEEYALLEQRITDALRAADAQARKEELAECGRVLFGLADEFDALSGGQIGNEIVHGVLTDQSCFVRNLATTLGCVEEAPPCAT